MISSEGIRNALEAGIPHSPLSQGFLSEAKAVVVDDTMQDILPQVANSTWPVPVVDADNVYKGVVSKNRFLRTLHRTDDVIHNEGEQ